MPDPVACMWMRTGPETGELGTHGCLSHSLAVHHVCSVARKVSLGDLTCDLV
jgi:hypothetical protein